MSIIVVPFHVAKKIYLLTSSNIYGVVDGFFFSLVSYVQIFNRQMIQWDSAR